MADFCFEQFYHCTLSIHSPVTDFTNRHNQRRSEGFPLFIEYVSDHVQLFMVRKCEVETNTFLVKNDKKDLLAV